MPLLINHRNESLSEPQIQREARQLDGIAAWFLSGNDEADAFHAWHQRLAEISTYGMTSVKAVFDEMQKAHNRLNQLSTCVDVCQYGENLQIKVASCRQNMHCAATYRDIGAIVGTRTVYSAADAGRNPQVRQRHLTAFTKRA